MMMMARTIRPAIAASGRDIRSALAASHPPIAKAMKWLILSETRNAASGNCSGLSDESQRMPQAQKSKANHRTLASVRRGIGLLNTAVAAMSNGHRRGAQCPTINITVIALVVVAVVLGGCALIRRGRLALVFLAAGLFTALAALAVGINAEWLAALDTSVETWFGAHRSRNWQVDASGIFRFIGQPLHVASAAMVCGTLLSLQARSALPAVLVVGVTGVGFVIEQTLKALVGRTSTAVAELQNTALPSFEHSFPSGHVTGSAALLGMIAVCLGTGRGCAVKTALTVPVVAGVLFVAFIAVYARAHTFSDVIGGMILGGAIVTLGAAVLGFVNSRRGRESVRM